MNKDIFLYATARLYSRIVLRKLNHNQLLCFRKVERDLKKAIKFKADINYLKKVDILKSPFARTCE